LVAAIIDLTGVLFCDFVNAGTGASFSFPEVSIGVPPVDI